jgi:hypothetical protein
MSKSVWNRTSLDVSLTSNMLYHVVALYYEHVPFHGSSSKSQLYLLALFTEMIIIINIGKMGDFQIR